MSTLKNTLIFLLVGMTWTSFAQCNHDPTITPNSVILCPNEYDTLWTQTYDSYQWYKDGVPVPGATNQFLIIDQFNYAGTMVTVEATLSGCAEESPGVLVDGWMFLPPFVINGGDYNFNGSVYEVCVGDTITFELGLPYNTNIEWTADGNVLSGETDQLIAITSSIPTGVVSYHVCGSPSECPNYTACLGMNLYVQFINCSSVGIDELTSETKTLMKITNLLGQETVFKTNTPLIYIYSDGSTERVYQAE